MPTSTSLLNAVSLALSSLRAHKLRSFLTLLGVIIGVGSVVIVGAAIEGLGSYAEFRTSQVFGTDSFQIGQLLQVTRLSRRERIEKLKYNRPIREEEYRYLEQAVGDQLYLSPYRTRIEDVSSRGGKLEDAQIIGVSANLAAIREVALTEGRFFTPQEDQGRSPVAVIGEEVRTALFPETSPVGKTFRLSGFEFTVVGVQEKLGSAGGASQDTAVFIPATVFTRLYGTQRSMILFARARPESGLNLEAAVDTARMALRSRFKTRPGLPDNFDTISPDTVREFVGQILALIGAVVVPITAISLVVGGIVIMNIMLVSVTERTREIGVRKSLGARRSDLMLQFLLESLIMSAAGGIIGLAGGFAVARVASVVSGVELRVTLPYVLLSLFVSSLVGVLSGWYPASRAARMDPVEALRAE